MAIAIATAMKAAAATTVVAASAVEFRSLVTTELVISSTVQGLGFG